ncbi:hypothetical protein [Blastococcus saxobsidens]|uniref:Putative Thioredoxin-like protein n=1 Tax=Blastococcus saxobsidens (strain DD2) TaxID=1146883 RepID=H6RNI6_BLASD|nr:hypothetical protein [Blastococcus saxobsidens]CCG03933.1 Putative Thioredoxin-like protein [Blastococcus saxobsidens DD2]
MAAEPAVAGAADAAVAGLFAAAGAPPPDGPSPLGPLGDPEVEQRLTELDELLGRVEQLPGPAGELALEAVAALAEVYGAALTRAVAYASGATRSTGTPLVEAFTGDDLLGHLLALHGIHPDPVEVRIARALDDVRAQLEAQGEVTFLGIEDGVAEVRVTGGGGGGCGSGCGCSSASTEPPDALVRNAVLATAPELSDVRVVVVQAARPATFIPLDSLLRSPAQPSPR